MKVARTGNFREFLSQQSMPTCPPKSVATCFALVVFLLLWWSSCNFPSTTYDIIGTFQHFWEVPEYSKAPRVITWHNLDNVLAGVANKKRELIVTTFAGQKEDEDFEVNYGMTAWNLNFVGHLRKLNLSNYLIIGADDVACEMTSRSGIPCWQDGLNWETRVRFYRGRQVALKWFYLQQIVERGYHPIFLDNDVVVLQDPFKHWNRSYDFQGLYDMNSGRRAEQVSDYNRESGVICPLVTMGDYYTNWPCMSTGVMYVRATPASHAAISAMVDHLSREPRFWEQAMWQTEVLPFVSEEERTRVYLPPRHAQRSMAARAPTQTARALNFELLPLEKFHNVNTLRARRRFNLTLDSVMVHCGYIHGFDKIVHLQALRLWLPPENGAYYEELYRLT